MKPLEFIHDVDATKAWLEMMNITQYMLLDHKEGEISVNVQQNVNLSQKRLSAIPVQFAKVEGNFNCSGNKLTDLKGMPRYVNGDFDCSYNYIESLMFGPIEVERMYKANNNQISNLTFLPKVVGSNFNLACNKLIHIGFDGLDIKLSINLKHNAIETISSLPIFQDNSSIYLENQCDFMQEFLKHYPNVRDDCTAIELKQLEHYVGALNEKMCLESVINQSQTKNEMNRFKI
jgi:hypothetical protein